MKHPDQAHKANLIQQIETMKQAHEVRENDSNF